MKMFKGRGGEEEETGYDISNQLSLPIKMKKVKGNLPPAHNDKIKH